jgi:hypothetical protein
VEFELKVKREMLHIVLRGRQLKWKNTWGVGIRISVHGWLPYWFTPWNIKILKARAVFFWLKLVCLCQINKMSKLTILQICLQQVHGMSEWNFFGCAHLIALSISNHAGTWSIFLKGAKIEINDSNVVFLIIPCCCVKKYISDQIFLQQRWKRNFLIKNIQNRNFHNDFSPYSLKHNG